MSGEKPIPLSARLDGALTARKKEVLQTALYAGYFNWPRDADSTSIAKTPDIAHSTFNQHLRAAESKEYSECSTGFRKRPFSAFANLRFAQHLTRG
ncbi:helix-turn-helix domain-containing protein [Halalkalirubrum salinum]|uniref:helix-turn-helix domain-containing protein n=1 Tax=Halalkalirubrum salinum TaxID=2563889 RepID=UPI0014851C81